MTQEEYVSFETAKLLKKAGFPQLSDTVYTNSDFMRLIGEIKTDSKYMIAAPSQALAIRWLREEYGVHVSPRYVRDKDRMWWTCDLIILHNCNCISDDFCCDKVVCSHNDNIQKAEQAAEAGIKAVCEYVIKQNQP